MPLPLVKDPARVCGDEEDELASKNPATSQDVAQLRRHMEEAQSMLVQGESCLNSLRHEVELLEADFNRVPRDTILHDDFISLKQRFEAAVTQCKSTSLKFSKKYSLANEAFPERRVFATRARFLKQEQEIHKKYREALIQLLRRPENAQFRAKRRTLSERGKQVLLTWFDNHRSNPFPTAEEKESLAIQIGANVDQISTWFINTRARRGRALDNDLAELQSFTKIKSKRRRRHVSEIML